MYLTTVIARLGLALVFGIAGISKFTTGLSATRKTLTDFGLPSVLASPVSVLLPVAELLTAILLVATPSGWSGSILALCLFLIFNFVIAANLLLGRKPNCNCFGQLHSKPIGWSTFARNCIVAAVAAGLVWQLPQHRDASLMRTLSAFSRGEITGALVALTGFTLIAVLGFLLLHVLKQHGRLLLRIEALEKSTTGGVAATRSPTTLQGLPVGSKAPEFQMQSVRGTNHNLESFLVEGKAALLLFTDPNCGQCLSLMSDVARWQNEQQTELNVVLISTGLVGANRSKAEEFGLANMLVEKPRTVAEGYKAFGTPSAVLIRSDGTVGSFLASGALAIRQLIEHKAWTLSGYTALLKSLGFQPPPAPPNPSPAVGAMAPAFTLSDIDGRPVTQSSLNGRATALLFWNPQCGFCQRMLPQLKEWETRKLSYAPRLVLVSAGTVESNRVMGLESSVLIDSNFAVGGIYGSRGTPSAILIDSTGKIASPLVVGGPSVMDLISGARTDGAPAPPLILGTG